MAAILVGVRAAAVESLIGLYLVVGVALAVVALPFTVLNLWGVLLGLVWMAGPRKDYFAGAIVLLSNTMGVIACWTSLAMFVGTFRHI